MTKHLIHIGYPKAGSTYLQRWFEAHPQLAYGEGSIAGFRDVYAIARAGATSNDAPLYRVTSFEGLSAPQGNAGQQFVSYSTAPAIDIPTAQLNVCTMMASLFPSATVLIVTRGFRSMILSSYSQFVRSGGDAGLADLGNVAIGAHGSTEHERLVQRAPWDYDRVIGAYTDAFGAENVIVMPYELLRDDATQFTRVLSRHLGIEQIEGSRDRVNESLSPVEMYWYPRITRLVRRLRSQRLFRLYIRAAFHNRLKGPIRILQRLRPGTPVTAATLPDAILEQFRGRAESLRDHPLYAPYLADYLLS
jgi:hypothetical protein